MIQKILEDGPEFTRELTHMKMNHYLSGIVPTHDPIKSVLRIPFELIVAPATADANYAELNLELVPSGCFGRMALSAAYVEKHFNGATIVGLDVIQDSFRIAMSEDMQAKILQYDDYLPEVIQYEDPHVILGINGAQCEPLSVSMGIPIVHPKVTEFPIWDFIHSGMLCAVAHVSQDMGVKREALQQAEKSARTVEFLYQMGVYAALADDLDTVVRLATEILSFKPSARSLYVLYRVTEDPAYKERMVTEYTPKILDFFDFNF